MRHDSRLTKGLLYAHRLSFTVKLIMNLHARLAKPMSKADVAGLCRLIELLQSVRSTFRRHASFVAQVSGYVLQYLSWVALTVLGSAKVSSSTVVKEQEESSSNKFMSTLVDCLRIAC